MVKKYIQPDLDLDMNSDTRNDILSSLYHIPASKINDKGISPHGIGVYFSDIPMDKISGLASIDYKIAEEQYGFTKVDFLHNNELDYYKTRSEMIDMLNKEPNWKSLYKKDILEKLPHINNYYTLINQLPKIDSIDKLAMFLAIIRPAKKYLIDNVIKYGWDSIKDKIWVKESSEYMYKKSHAIAYAQLVVLALNRINNSMTNI